MIRPFVGRQRLLLFRSYLYLVAGLLAVAIVLDFGFGYLQDSQDTGDDRWLLTTFDMIERELAALPADQRQASAATLGDEIGIVVQLLESGDIVTNVDQGKGISTLVDDDGNTSFLYYADAINATIRLAPAAQPRESIVLKLLPPVFYLSIFVVVGIWLRPLLRDINLITHGAQQFAADYRKPLATAKKTTELTSLATNLDDMSSRLSGLIQNQKELIAALSHEMRTPLARIRFALAVMGNDADAKVQEHLDALNDDVQEVDDLIASMLNYARLDHPDLRMNWQEVPVQAWLRKVTEKHDQPDKELLLTGGETDEMISMDPRLMEIALSNLLVNAFRYADKRVAVSLVATDDKCLITVEDDGKGVPESERDIVFKAFTRIDDSRNRETGSYGLGLAIVARIAELHVGSATVDSSERLGGARFDIRWGPPPGDS